MAFGLVEDNKGPLIHGSLKDLEVLSQAVRATFSFIEETAREYADVEIVKYKIDSMDFLMIIEEDIDRVSLRGPKEKLELIITEILS